MLNYIPDVNKFGLAGPPLWWLKALWAFDASLVVVPSRQSCVYRLAQRRKLNLPDHIVNDSLFKESDTKMLATYSLIPVTSILPTAAWSFRMLQELKARSPHMQGGAAVVNAKLDAEAQEEEVKKREEQNALLTFYGKEGWKQYRKRIGLGKTIFLP